MISAFLLSIAAACLAGALHLWKVEGDVTF